MTAGPLRIEPNHLPLVLLCSLPLQTLLQYRKRVTLRKARGGGGTPYDGLYGKAPPKRGIFFRLQVFERVGISLVDVFERVGNLSFGALKGPKRANRCIL